MAIEAGQAVPTVMLKHMTADGIKEISTAELLSGKKETDAFLKRAFSQPLAFAPGTKAIYTNVGMSILGIIIEKVSGMMMARELK